MNTKNIFNWCCFKRILFVCLFFTIVLILTNLSIIFSDDKKTEEASDTQSENDEIDKKTEEAIKKGVEWLLKAQNKDGSWGTDARTPGDITCTSVACLALMSQGNTENRSLNEEIAKAIRDGTEYIIKNSSDGRFLRYAGGSSLVQSKLGQHAHTFFAVVFLTQIYGMSYSKELNRIKDTISDMVRFIDEKQESDGSWHKQSFGALKATGMAWLSLRCANSTGISIKHATIDKTLDFVKKQFDSKTKFYKCKSGYYGGGYNYQTIYDTATALRMLYAVGEGNNKDVIDATETLLNALTSKKSGISLLDYEGEDYLAALYITQALAFENGNFWKKWFPWIKKKLLHKQNKDGSWTGIGCLASRTFATSCALMTLQTPYQLLPFQKL